ncbi:uncharacterized protein HaLaN_26824, partial [Haematococcus lacustris]
MQEARTVEASLKKTLENAQHEAKAKVQRQLAAATKTSTDLRTELSQCNSARAEQERRLDSAGSQVAAMRAELLALNSRLAARDQQLLAHVEEVEARQLQVLRDEAADCQEQLTQLTNSHTALLHAALSVAQTIAHGPVAAAFSFQGRHLVRLTSGEQQHAQLIDRLTAAVAYPRLNPISSDDAAALVARVRDLLHSAREVALHAERSEVALASETDVVVEGLRQQVQQLTLAQQAIQE